MFYLDLHVAATLEMPCTGPYFAVHMPTNGTARCTVDGRDLEADTTRAMVTSPGQAVTIRLTDDCPQLIIRIEREALTRHLTRLLGRALTEAVVFEPALNLISDPATRWHSAIQLVNTEVFHGGSLLQRGHGIGPLEELIMSTLAYLQPSTVHEHLLRPGAPAGRAVVRQSLEYLEAHLREAITVADLARHVHMSVRAVQQAFREELDTTPMAYLRDRRLERARQELADALASDGVTVTAVAEHWGFGHLSNFAALYRRRWGESPSDTLHR
jgi:AraC-like DNA-binding protein